MVKKRVSKFELMRIIAMFLIVLHHSIVHGVLDNKEQVILAHPTNAAISLILAMGGKIGVFIFVLITGYFMINSHISVKKVIKLWLPIFFWSVLLFFVFSSWQHDLSLKSCIKSIFPIIFNQYWFMTVYFFMYCLIPFLNVVVKAINSKKKTIYFCLLGLVLITSTYDSIFGGPGNVGSMLIDFCIIYCWGALLRQKKALNNVRLMGNNKIALIVTLSLNILIISIGIYAYSLTHILKFYSIAAGFAVNPSSLLIVLISVELFIWIGSSNIGYHSWMNKIAAVAFGIYLISDNNYVRPWIWHTIFHMNDCISKSPLLIIGYTLLVSVIVFIVSALLEYCRKLIFSKFEDKLANKIQSIINI